MSYIRKFRPDGSYKFQITYKSTIVQNNVSHTVCKLTIRSIFVIEVDSKLI
jgi:hypothetical protein